MTQMNQIKSLSVLKNFSRVNTINADNSSALTERSRDSSKNTNLTHYTSKTNKTDNVLKVKKINYISKIPYMDQKLLNSQNNNTPHPGKSKTNMKLSPYLVAKINDKLKKEQREDNFEICEEMPCNTKLDLTLTNTGVNKPIVSSRAARANIPDGVYTSIHRRGTENYKNNPLLGDSKINMKTEQLTTSTDTRQSFASERTINKAPINFGIDGIFSKKDNTLHVQNVKLSINKLVIIDKSLLNILEFLTNEDIASLWKISKRMRLIMYNAIYGQYSSLINKFKTCNKTEKLFEYLKFGLVFTVVNRNKILIDLQLLSRVITDRRNIDIKLHFITRRKGDFLCNTFLFDVINEQSTRSVWMCREFTEFHLDPLQKCSVQPVLQFSKDDLLIFNINLLSIDKGFVDCNNSNFKLQVMGTTSTNNIPFSNKDIVKHFNSRICELEMFRTRWKDISTYPNAEIVVNKINLIFSPFLTIMQILFDDVGYLIFKIVLKATRKGKIKDKKEIGINVRVVGHKEVVKNEVKKNNLIYDKRNTIELRIGDELIFYLSHNK